MSEITNRPIRVIGCDVGKDFVVVHDTESDKFFEIVNTPVELRRFLAGYAGPTLVVCEPTGGHEVALLEAAFLAGFEAHRADGRKAKAFLRSFHSYAKTDKIDAHGLSRYGIERRDELRLWTPPPPELERLCELVRLREVYVQQASDHARRLTAPNLGLAKRYLKRMADYTRREIEKLQHDIDVIVGDHRYLAGRVEVIRGVKGFGAVIAATFVALLPELGHVSRREIAALAGVAPHPDASGRADRRRHVRGGRKEIKRLLFLAAMSASRHDPDMKAFHDRLIGAGKTPMVALVAVARKMVTIINARIRDHEAAILAEQATAAEA